MVSEEKMTDDRQKSSKHQGGANFCKLNKGSLDNATYPM